MRAGGAMSGMRLVARPGREEDALLTAPGRDIAVTAVVAVLTAVVFVAVADHGALLSIKRWDDTWLRLMISGRTPPLTAIARALNVLGLVYVTLPARIAIAGFLPCNGDGGTSPPSSLPWWRPRS